MRYLERFEHVMTEYDYRWFHHIFFNLTDTKTLAPSKMKLQWTPGMAQDLFAYHALDAEEELTAILTEEINREIVNNLLNEYGGAF